MAEVWDHPPVSDPRAWDDALQALCARREDIGIVFPVGEREIELAAPLAVRLPVLVVVVAPAVLAVCRSKRALLALAAEVGVATGPWQTVDTPSALDQAFERVGLPAVLKPDRYAGDTLGFKAAIIASAEEGRRLAGKLVFPACGFVVQHLAPGVRHNVYFVARQGRLRGYLEVRILRTDRHDGTGLAVEGVSVAPNPVLLTWSEALVARLGYSGAGCAQFILDESTGSACFLEINARLGANCSAACACGLDLPRLFVESLLGVATEEPRPEIGRHYAWLYGDLSGLAFSIRKGNLTWTQAVAWIVQATHAQIQARDHVTWTWRDPLPTLAMFAKLVRAFLRFVRRRLGGVVPPEHFPHTS
ncbi:MAG TPA: hypothetical protein VM716_02340 [Gemmatimonadales bacterium]|nr:hypothetical protein [Gemmatimonadales bacterium]